MRFASTLAAACLVLAVPLHANATTYDYVGNPLLIARSNVPTAPVGSFFQPFVGTATFDFDTSNFSGTLLYPGLVSPVTPSHFTGLAFNNGGMDFASVTFVDGEVTAWFLANSNTFSRMRTSGDSLNTAGSSVGPFVIEAFAPPGHWTARAVPGPVVGAGIPGLILTLGALLGWMRRRNKKEPPSLEG